MNPARAESARFTFEGRIEGELPLEAEFLQLVRKHGINIQAQVRGVLAIDQSRSLFDPVGTRQVELSLQIGQLQTLLARQLETSPSRSLPGAAASVSVSFSGADIAWRDPEAFPARIGLPMADSDQTAFVLERFDLSLSPSFFQPLLDGASRRDESVAGHFTLVEVGGENEGRRSQLDLVITTLTPAERRSLWESKEWQSLQRLVDSLYLGDDAPDLTILDSPPVIGGGDEGGGDGGGDGIGGGDDDDLTVVPEPAAMLFAVAMCAGGMALLRRRRRARAER